MGGSFRVEWVAGFVWNQWQPWWSGIRTSPHANSKEVSYKVAGMAPIRYTTLPGPFRIYGEQPHDLGTLPITRKKPKPAAKLGGGLDGLGHNSKPKLTT